ncbi:hypothetical protein EDB92DRAFT_459350 [Lactarius akahatsu]|uniref:Uncharacterized protein n=1 Tax=Lactarius akahatsu TaxID=416441 RepID=A0AAD4LRM0_9AGAM|nr:hypothetical protein EDB92DRAFT_459350 [Lactarius akahatsu]
MAPFKKPLFAPPPPLTLYHFFMKADLSINQSASSSFKAPKRVKVGLSNSRIKQKTTHTPAEIIVLVSEDDAPVMRTKRKAKDPAESSSDVEVVEILVDVQQAHTSSSRKMEKTAHGAGFGGSGIECLFTLPQDESLHFVGFGRPRLLVPTEDTRHSTEGEQPLATGSGFPQDESSVPTSAPLLAADLGVSARSAIVASDSNSHISATTPSSCLDNLIKIDDEWSTGDDELARPNPGEFEDVLKLTDDDEVQHVLKVEGESLSASGDNTLDQCPFCGRSLTSLAPLVSSLL